MKFDCIVNNISFWIKNNKVCLLNVQRKFVSNKPCCNTLLSLKRLSLTDVSNADRLWLVQNRLVSSTKM